MEIPKKTWSKYIDKLSAINEKAGSLMQEYIQKNGINDSAKLIAYAYTLVERYGITSVTLSCMMYDELAAVSKANVPPAVPAELPTLEETAIAINGAKLRGEGDISRCVSRLVKQAGQDTTINNAIRDGAEHAWIPQGDTCAFCITLASRGWQKASKKMLKNGHAEHIHANCDCAYAVRFHERDKVGGYDPDEYKAEYDGAGKDVNTLRRKIYQEQKDSINAQKREAYARRMSEKNGPDAEEVSGE